MNTTSQQMPQSSALDHHGSEGLGFLPWMPESRRARRADPSRAVAPPAEKVTALPLSLDSIDSASDFEAISIPGDLISNGRVAKFLIDCRDTAHPILHFSREQFRTPTLTSISSRRNVTRPTRCFDMLVLTMHALAALSKAASRASQCHGGSQFPAPLPGQLPASPPPSRLAYVERLDGLATFAANLHPSAAEHATAAVSDARSRTASSLMAHLEAG